MNAFRKLFFQLSLFTFLSLSAFSHAENPAKFLYFSQGFNNSADGKYVLAAFDSGEGEEPINYYYASIDSKSGQIGIASDPVFWAGEELDFRGYGPIQSSWSFRHTDTDRVDSELVATFFQGRKSSSVVFHTLKDVGGVKKLVKAPFDITKYRDLCAKLVKEKAEKVGFNNPKVDWMIDDDSFLSPADYAKTKFEKDDFPRSFSLDEGRYIEIGSYFTVADHNGESKASPSGATAKLIVNVSLDADGNLTEKIISSQANLE